MSAIADFLIFLFTLVPLPKDLPEEQGFTGQTPLEFQKTFDEMHPKGWRLMRIKGYEKDGDSRLDSQWNKPAEPAKFWCHHNLDRDLYVMLAASYKNDGYVEKLKSAWMVGGKERIWTVWEKK